MKLTNNIIPYLNDEKFSEGLYITVAKSQKNIPDRISYVCDYSRGKKIIHVGCLDHEQLIQKKIDADTWLHKKIDEVAAKQVGIDINRPALAFVKEKTIYQNVFYEDITSDEPVGSMIQEEQWDAMILGEILEHVNDPIQFLKKLKSKYAPFVKEVLISVPNAFALENFRFALSHKENINSDHRFWFTVYTLAKNLTLAGYTNFQYNFVCYEPHEYRRRYLQKLLQTRFPALRSTIMMHTNFDNS